MYLGWKTPPGRTPSSLDIILVEVFVVGLFFDIADRATKDSAGVSCRFSRSTMEVRGVESDRGGEVT